jgi:hypothetical protein
MAGSLEGESDMAENPTRVVLYSYLKGEAEAALDFRWDPADGVTIIALDPDLEWRIREYHERGTPLDAEQRSVRVSEGPEFMRALLQPSNSTYYQFVDESGHESSWPQ